MLIREIRLQNLLSFGPNTPPLELRPLNVLIGANGSGKSNLIEAIGLLQAAPDDISEPIRKGGGPTEWIWKGSKSSDSSVDNSWVGLEVSLPFGSSEVTTHRITFEQGLRSPPFYVNEDIRSVQSSGVWEEIYSSFLGDARIAVSSEIKKFELPTESVHQSVLAIRGLPTLPTKLDVLADDFERIRIFRDFKVGRDSVLRSPQRADERSIFLSEDLKNFGLIINKLRSNAAVKESLLSYLENLSDDISDIGVDIEGGTVQVFLQERKYNIPAVRLSDGTLRFLCLLAILCHPNPPPLICIEEPELGLHPDMMSTLAELLRDASTRTQLIVTTHSDVLVDAFSETPEDVIVCEKHDGCTTMKRLVKAELAGWLENYSLGNLWTSGQIGGNRW